MLEDQVVLKEDRLMLVTERGGDIPRDNAEGLGLYLGDTRFLSAYLLTLNDRRPLWLSTTMDEGFVATIQMVNPRLDSGALIPRQTISILRTRFLSDGLHERIAVQNCLPHPVEVRLALEFDADFRDIFDVREFGVFEFLGRRRPMRQVETGLLFSYDGLDGRRRSLDVRLQPLPDSRRGRSAVYLLELEAHETWTLEVGLLPDDQRPSRRTPAVSFDAEVEALGRSYAGWSADCAAITTDNGVLNQVLRRCLNDLRMLLDDYDTGPYPTAGVPWFAVPFGRDGLIVGTQTLALNPAVARGVLRFLAAQQGARIDMTREEEPGKIMHELRTGELAGLHQVPHTPYYGSIDSTPLFLVLVAELMNWQWDQALFAELEPNIRRALAWIDSATSSTGLVEFHGFAPHGIRNQGWKDSEDSLTHADGTTADTPAALVEVQAYVVRAWEGIAAIYRSLGRRHESAELASKARGLRQALDGFWMPGRRFYAQAIDGGRRPVEVVTSNPGHALWAHALPAARARMVARTLLAPTLWTGWGIRTLASDAPSYNPMSYHNGSVWPHDNSLIADGLRRYGLKQEAMTVIDGVLAAAMRLPGHHLPELFCGFERDRRFESRPAEYVVSGQPQAWGAAAAFHLLQSALGLRPDLAAGRLTLDPGRSALYDEVHVERLPVGGERVSFTVTWDREGRPRLETERQNGLPVVLA